MLVRSLPPSPASERELADPALVRAIVRGWPLAPDGWSPRRGRPLVPLFVIEVSLRDRSKETFWLGRHSNPPRFPCYSLCSGSWVAPSTENGRIDHSRWKGVTSRDWPFLMAVLGS